MWVVILPKMVVIRLMINCSAGAESTSFLLQTWEWGWRPCNQPITIRRCYLWTSFAGSLICLLRSKIRDRCIEVGWIWGRATFIRNGLNSTSFYFPHKELYLSILSNIIRELVVVFLHTHFARAMRTNIVQGPILLNCRGKKSLIVF